MYWGILKIRVVGVEFTRYRNADEAFGKSTKLWRMKVVLSNIDYLKQSSKIDLADLLCSLLAPEDRFDEKKKGRLGNFLDTISLRFENWCTWWKLVKGVVQWQGRWKRMGETEGKKELSKYEGNAPNKKTHEFYPFLGEEEAFSETIKWRLWFLHSWIWMVGVRVILSVRYIRILHERTRPGPPKSNSLKLWTAANRVEYYQVEISCH